MVFFKFWYRSKNTRIFFSMAFEQALCSQIVMILISKSNGCQLMRVRLQNQREHANSKTLLTHWFTLVGTLKLEKGLYKNWKLTLSSKVLNNINSHHFFFTLWTFVMGILNLGFLLLRYNNLRVSQQKVSEFYKLAKLGPKSRNHKPPGKLFLKPNTAKRIMIKRGFTFFNQGWA